MTQVRNEYVGKGPFQRMIQSAIEKMNQGTSIDEVVAMMWKPAANDVEAFIGDYLLQAGRGVLSNIDNAMTYNKIWSPGKKLFERLFT